MPVFFCNKNNNEFFVKKLTKKPVNAGVFLLNISAAARCINRDFADSRTDYIKELLRFGKEIKLFLQRIRNKYLE